MPRARPGPEQQARALIDAQLADAGWVVQDREDANLAAADGVAVREFRLADAYGYADYLLFVDGKAVGVVEAKPVGHSLTSIELQATKYSAGLPPGLNPPLNPQPFVYVSTGIETAFINLLDPDPRSQRISAVPHIHRPKTLAEWLRAEPRVHWPAQAAEPGGSLASALPSTLRSRILALPPLEPGSLYPNQIEAVERLELSLQKNRPRSLVQMATGSGKTIFAVTAVYRLIKHAGARRVLFLVDRTNLGEQAEKEFQGYRTPDGNRKFTELYNVQRLASNTIMDSSRVVITTVQRLYSMLKGEPGYGPRGRGAIAVRVGRRGHEGAAADRLQLSLSAGVLRRYRHRRMPPLDLHTLAPGAGILRRLPRRTHGHAGQAHFRVLQPQPRHGVLARASRGRPCQRGLRDLLDPYEDLRARLDHRGTARSRGRVPRPPDTRAAVGTTRRGRDLPGGGAGSSRGCPRPDPDHHSHVQGEAADGDLPRP